jgi:hypothetical protein
MTRQSNWDMLRGMYPPRPVNEQMLDDWNRQHPMTTPQAIFLQPGWNPLIGSVFEIEPHVVMPWKPVVQQSPLAGHAYPDELLLTQDDLELISERMP